ncbi:hypothetical protein SAMN05660226_02277 [Parapedobacter luteus]|uniref:PRTase-CE domain-containing protein n=1 Tax=Parapedobacter luteus TaxID=623280 RepID=A0A1T5CK34_9SPHI|nr:hypothetical protein [Parapedobacter luteus]SKB59703.1 hypothetical protein SAMN05660226_02277 [Parapedobacter luteus]
MPIRLPPEWNIYYNEIRDRCQALIESGIWSGIDINQLNAWRKNFKTDEEKYFSACVLDSLIYRSNQQTFSLINNLLNKGLNNTFRQIGLKEMAEFPLNVQSKIIDPLVRFIPVITTESPVTKSSFEILRFFKRYFRIQEKWMIYPSDIKRSIENGVKAFIFIDDFLGTGVQFDDTLVYANIYNEIEQGCFVYAPLIAHELGINQVKHSTKNMHITYAELLVTKAHSFFNNYFEGQQDEAREFYKHLMTDRAIPFDPVTPFGYGNLEITLSFEHAAPDNSLQILHYQSSNWNSLFHH